MQQFIDQMNSSKVSPEVRLAALRGYLETPEGKEAFPFINEDANINLRTIYSFSPYTPTMAAFMAKKQGLKVTGCADSYNISGVQEMRSACDVLRIGFVNGMELFVNFFDTPFKDKILNVPFSPGIVRMNISAIPSANLAKLRDFLIPILESRHVRNHIMVENMNTFMENTGKIIFEPFSYEKDVVPLSKFSEGGFVSQRHIVCALAIKLCEKFPNTDDLVYCLKYDLQMEISQDKNDRLQHPDNPHLLHDLVDILFDDFLPKIYVQPDDWECVSAEMATEFIHSIGGIPSYVYLGKKNNSSFENDYLNDLFLYLKELGFVGVTFDPAFLTPEEFARITVLCKRHDFLQIVGHPVFGSRESFSSPLLHRPEFSYLLDTIWALAAHELLSSANKGCGLFSHTDPLSLMPIDERIRIYSDIGRRLQPLGTLSLGEAGRQLSKFQREYSEKLRDKIKGKENGVV